MAKTHGASGSDTSYIDSDEYVELFSDSDNSSHGSQYPEEWEEPDWDWGSDSSLSEALNEQNISGKSGAYSEEDTHCGCELNGRSFSVTITPDMLPGNYTMEVDNQGGHISAKADQSSAEAARELFQICYEMAQPNIDLESLVTAHGVSEVFWGLYKSGAYDCENNTLSLTRWFPIWDKEIPCANGRCFVLQHNSGIGREFFIWPYNSSNTDHLHILISGLSKLDEECIRKFILAIAQRITLHQPQTVSVEEFLQRSLIQKENVSDFVSSAEDLTSVFIWLQPIVVKESLLRLMHQTEESSDVNIDECFNGITVFYSKAIDYLERLLDSYDAQVNFGANVHDRSEMISYVGGFDGNLLPPEIPEADELAERISSIQNSEKLTGLRRRLESARWQLRNNPAGPTIEPSQMDTTTSGVSETVEDPSYSAQVGDEFYLGKYYWADDKSTRPIKWIIMSIKGAHALCVSKQLIDCLHFNEFEGDVTWETSTIREWLNNEFADVAFDTEDRKKIAGAKLKNAENRTYGTPGGNVTKDRIFLLSEDEASILPGLAIGNEVLPTPFAESRGSSQWWWLRSPGHVETHVAYACGNELINSSGTKPCLLARGIRPAFYLKLSTCGDITFNPDSGE